MNYRKYMQSKSWKEKRQAKLDARSGKCECKGGCTREATQVHHLHYDSLGNESLDDLQALCPKCHMQKSKVRNFYGNTHYRCCLKEGEQSPEKILPYDVWNEANFHYQMGNTGRRNDLINELMWNALFPDGGLKQAENPNFPDIPVEYLGRYDQIALELETNPVIVALLDNLGLMFDCDDIGVSDAVTEAIGRFVDIVKEDHFSPEERAKLLDEGLIDEKHQERLFGTDATYQIKPEFQKFFQTDEY